jgi:ligand-binding sensor domain-containing protein
MLFDSQGFMWIGTNEGLNRFDGNEFIVYKRTGASKFSLCGNVITDILEDRNGTLWVATRDGGICNLNTKTGEVLHPILTIENLAEQSYAHCIFQNKEGYIFAGTDKGIFRSNDGRVFELIPQTEQTSWYEILETNNTILAAPNLHGLCEIFSDSIAHLAEGTKGPYPRPAYSLNDIFIDDKNNCWLGAWDNYLHRHDHQTKTTEHIDFLRLGSISYSDDEIRSITEVAPGQLWIAMRSKSIYNFSIESGTSALVQFSQRESTKLNGKRIHFLQTDKLNRTWIGTDNGLHLYDPAASKFNVVNLPSAAVANDMIRFNNNLLIATSSGVMEKSLDSNTPLSIVAEQLNCTSLSSSQAGVVVGTGTSLFSYTINQKKLDTFISQKHFYFDIHAITASRYIQIIQAKHSDKNLLLASPYGHGIIVIEPSTQRWNLFNVLWGNTYENLIRNIYQDNRGRIWFMASSGISLLDYIHHTRDNTPISLEAALASDREMSLQCELYNKGLLSKEVTAMCENENGTFWVSTQGGGLYLFTPENKEMPFSAIQSPVQSMSNMIKDLNDNLWIAAAGGLFLFETKTNNWTKYNDRDGIPQDGLSGALFADSTGEIFAGGNGFYMRFHPDKLVSRHEAPNPAVTHIAVMDVRSDSLLNLETIVLPHSENFLSFDFASLCFSDPSSVIYSFKLDGLDENWRDNGNVNKVSYSDLSPGEYVFRVKAKMAGNSVFSNEAVIHIHILNPFYLRWWFIVLVAGIGGFGVWSFLRYRNFQKKKLDAVRNKIARDLHDDIGSALGSISFFSETAKRTLDDKNTTGTNNVLNKIGSTSREMIENMHDIVWAVNPNNDSFHQLAERMKSYAADMASANDIRLVFNASPELSSLKLSMDERKNLFLIFKEAVYNSCKYAACSEIQIELVRQNSHRLCLKVNDNGCGFNPDETKGGNGLRNMKSRAAEIGATYRIVSSTNSGTAIEVIL